MRQRVMVRAFRLSCRKPGGRLRARSEVTGNAAPDTGLALSHYLCRERVRERRRFRPGWPHRFGRRGRTKHGRPGRRSHRNRRRGRLERRRSTGFGVGGHAPELRRSPEWPRRLDGNRRARRSGRDRLGRPVHPTDRPRRLELELRGTTRQFRIRLVQPYFVSRVQYRRGSGLLHIRREVRLSALLDPRNLRLSTATRGTRRETRW